MSGTYPYYPEFASVDFKINTPVQKTETVNGRQRRAGFGTSYYSFSGKYATLLPDEAGPITSFLAEQYGSLESFQIVLPKISYNKAPDYAQAVGNVEVRAGITKGAYSVTLQGCGANKTILNAGDFFKFDNHTKVYMCTNTVTSDGTGYATLYFSAKLVENVATGVNLTINAVPFTVVLSKDMDEWTVGSGGLINIDVEFREVW